jgi:hypothetical protein
MDSYSVIADLGQTLVDLLRGGLCPDIIKNEGQIGLCSPVDRGDYALGLHFYYLKEDRENMRMELMTLSDSVRQYPPMLLKVGLMITAYSKAGLSDRALDEYKIMGRALQVLFDHKQLTKNHLFGQLKFQEQDLSIEYMNLEFDEQVRIWSLFNEPYKLSAFYEIAPVVVPSERTVEQVRVTSAELTLRRKK